MRQAPELLLPVLVHIQVNLDADLTLASLSERAGMSPSHFHRTFQSEIGETPAGYVARLRLERAAFRLHVQEASVLQIALDCGYHNHETFTRAFRRAFGRAPAAYRQWRRQQATSPPPSRTAIGRENRFALSATRVLRLRRMHLAFIRHIGPYQNVSDSIFDELDDWARRQATPGPRLWLGIGHDAPSTTAPNLLRFDAALITEGPFEPSGRIAHQVLEAADYAATTHIGSYSTLPDAYAEIFRRVTALKSYVFVGLPALEFYRTVKANTGLRVNETEICLPVRRAQD